MHMPKDVAFGGTRVMVPSPEAIRFDSTSAPEIGQAGVIGRLTADITRDAPYEIASYTRSVPESWRQAGRIWLSRAGWQPPEGSIVPTTGAQAAIMAIIAATTAPGDQVAFEELTYSSIARGALSPAAGRCRSRGTTKVPCPKISRGSAHRNTRSCCS